MDTITQIDIKKLIEIAKAQNVTWLALFGSLARGEATGASDVDLAVRFGKPISLFDLVGAQLAIEAALGRTVDLMPMMMPTPLSANLWPKIWSSCMKPAM